MAISATLTVFNAPFGIDETQSRMVLRGNLVWAAGTYVSGGQVPVAPPYLDKAGATVLISTLNVLPDELWIQSVAASGYVYSYDKATGKILILTGAAAQSSGTELAGGSLPAGVTSDVIEFYATWAKQ